MGVLMSCNFNTCNQVASDVSVPHFETYSYSILLTRVPFLFQFSNGDKLWSMD